MALIKNNTYYIKLPNELLNKVTIKQDRYYLLLFLLLRTYKQPLLPTGLFTSASYDDLAKRLKIGRTTFNTIIINLNKRGYIVRFDKGFKLNSFSKSLELNFPSFNLYSKKNQRRKFYSFQQINIDNATALLKIHKDALYQYSLMLQTVNRYTFTNRNDKRYSKDSAENVNGQMLSLEKIKHLMHNDYSKSQISKLNYRLEKEGYLSITTSTKEVDNEKYFNSGSSKFFMKNGKTFEWLCNNYSFNTDLKKKHNNQNQLGRSKVVTNQFVK